MNDIEQPLPLPVTPQRGAGLPRTPPSGRSMSSYSTSELMSERRVSFPASSYRASAVLETGSAIPLQFSTQNEPREIQIRRARDSIVGMSSVLSDMKSQMDNVRRASSSSEPLPAAPQPLEQGPSPSPGTAARERAARIKALGAPWMPLDPQPPLPHGPPPAFKAPLSPLSPPERPPALQGRAQGSPLDTESFLTAEEQASDEDPLRAMPTLPRFSSTNWRDLLSPSPPKRAASPQRGSLRQEALASDNDDDVGAAGVTPRRERERGALDGPTLDAPLGVFAAPEVVRMRRVRPTLRTADVAVPQEAAHEVSMRGTDDDAAPVPPRHEQPLAGRKHQRYHSGDSDAGERSKYGGHGEHEHSEHGHGVHGQGVRTHPQSQPQPGSGSHARAQSWAHAPARRAHAHSRSAASVPVERAGDPPRKRNFTKESITNLVETAGRDHPYDLDDIDLPGPERRLLEKFVNSLSKLSIEIQMDEGKREEGRRRLTNALRALEGWI